MKKLFTLFLTMLLPLMALGQSQSNGCLIAEKDWSGVTDDALPWILFEDPANGSAKGGADGIEITVNKKTGRLWQPEAMVLEGFDLQEGGNYRVVITAKLPCNGQIQINMGDWWINDQYDFPVTATGDFQEIVCDFPDYYSDATDAHVLFECGDFLGTSIVKKVQVFGLGDSDITYNYIEKGKVAEVIRCPKRYEGEIVIPETVMHEGVEYSVTKILYSAFSGCNKLTSITIPNSVTNIGVNAFSGCSGLTSVTIGNGVTSIGDYAFNNCSSLTSITIPNSVTSLGSYAFESCSGLTSVTIPNSMTSISNYTFKDCIGLTSVIIPNSVTNISEGVFNGCSGLSSVTIPNNVTDISYGVFYGCSGLTSITIPNNVTSIGNYAFYGCSGLNSLTIGNSVTSIGDYAFYNCSGLTSLTIPNNVTSIGDNAFESCSGLTSITIPNSMTSIGFNTFRYCKELTSVLIGSGVNHISGYAFGYCSQLKDVYCYAETVPDADIYAFQDSYPEYMILHVPEGKVDDYKAAEPWNQFKEIVSITLTKYTLTYMVEGEVYKTYELIEGERITPEAGALFLKRCLLKI